MNNLKLIEIDDDIINEMRERLHDFLLRAGIAQSSAKSLVNACEESLEKNGKEAYMKTVRSCCEELKLPFHELVDKAVDNADALRELLKKKLTEDDIRNLQDYI